MDKLEILDAVEVAVGSALALKAEGTDPELILNEVLSMLTNLVDSAS